MSRTLTSEVSTAVGQTVTRPRFLIWLGWSSNVRVCTAESVVWDGYTWAAAGARINQIGGANVNTQVSIDLPNHSGGYGAIALSEGLQDIPVKVWMLYGTSPFVTADAVLLFDGQMNGGRITLDKVTVDCIAMRAAFMYAPRLSLQPPLCNHLLPTGSVLTWNGDTFILERR